MKLILAFMFVFFFHIQDNESSELNFFQKEIYRQAEEVLKIDDDSSEFNYSSGWENIAASISRDINQLAKRSQSFEVLAPNIVVPEVETTYWCSVHKLPDFASRVHGTGFEISTSMKSKHLIHHMEVFGCDVNDGVIPNYRGECRSPDMPEQLTRCRRVLAAWASGAKTLWYPKEAGLTFHSSSKSQYVRLEIHYNNQLHEKGAVDSSGIRFFYSSEFRSFEVGVLEVGVIYSPDMVIPPNQKTFAWTGVCPAKCTQKALPQDGINIFATQLHAHLTGRKLWTSQTRDHLEISELSRDDNYSTYNERIVSEIPMKKVLPGDQLTLTCEFNTSGIHNVTYGGMGIHGEMCVSYVHYYPESDLEVCKSSVSKTALREYLTMQSLYQSTAKPLKSYDDVYWSPPAVEYLRLLYQYLPIRVHCLKPNGESWPGIWNNLSHFTREN